MFQRTSKILLPIIFITCLLCPIGCTQPEPVTTTTTSTMTTTTTATVTEAPVTVTESPVTTTVISTVTTTLFVVPATTTPADTTTVGLSKTNPADIQTPLTANIGNKGEIPGEKELYNVSITVLQVIRGATAWAKVENLNMYNEPPPDGDDYLLARVRFEYIRGPEKETSYEVSSAWFTAVSADGQDYKTPKIVGPSPYIDKILYPGNSVEGWLVFQVNQADSAPLMTIGRNYEGTGGLWFKLY